MPRHRSTSRERSSRHRSSRSRHRSSRSRSQSQPRRQRQRRSHSRSRSRSRSPARRDRRRHADDDHHNSRRHSSKEQDDSRRRRKRSRSGDDDDAEAALARELAKLKEAKRRKAEEKAARKAEKARKKAEKKAARAKESAEERARRKAAKAEKKKSLYFGYTNEDNPFGDSNLTEQFVWKKKEDRDVDEGKMRGAPSRRAKMREQEKLIDEINKVKERRKIREEEEEERERLRQEEISLREAEMYGDWEKKDEEFHKRNAKIKSKIRIREGRERPIDILAKNILLVERGIRRQKKDTLDEPLHASMAGDGDVVDEAGRELDMELQEPYLVLQGLPEEELEQLQQDIKVHIDVDKDGEHGSYWRALSIVCDEELRALKDSAQHQLGNGPRGGGASGGGGGASKAVHSSVEADVQEMFSDKSFKELAAMEPEINEMLEDPDEDKAYWSDIRRALTVHKAKAQLREIHEELLTKRLEQLEVEKEQAAAEAARRKALGLPEPAPKVPVPRRDPNRDLEREAAMASMIDAGSASASSAAAAAAGAPAAPAAPAAAAAAAQGSDSDSDAGNYSPVLLQDGGGGGDSDSDSDAGGASPMLEAPDGGNEGEVVDEEEDRRRLLEQRRAILLRERSLAGGGGAGGGAGATATAAGAAAPAVGPSLPAPAAGTTAAVPYDSSAGAAAMYQQTAGERSAPGEQAMGADEEVQLAREEAYLWHDKYRPRKPRYFNRVKTGYDWNKYNQSHYDHDNPPPKTVQGYKFNIFYPDLIDRTKTPTFFLEPADTPEFCIIRFHGGPPYEDIAFKIVNREWERSRKHGFRCVFQRGILHVYFNFKRYRYRR